MQILKKDHPILFSTPMVQAILEGRKTQTRRVVKPQPDARATRCELTKSWPKQGDWAAMLDIDHNPPIIEVTDVFKCPYSKVGDILWVRETFRIINHSGYGNPYFYKANACDMDLADKDIKWKPSIFMPKEACRIFLEITNIRVERLHDISEDDAKAEGVELYAKGIHYLNYTDQKAALTQFIYNCRTAKESYKTLWTLINGFRDEPYAWFKNPFVWVMEFKNHKP